MRSNKNIWTALLLSAFVSLFAATSQAQVPGVYRFQAVPGPTNGQTVTQPSMNAAGAVSQACGIVTTAQAIAQLPPGFPGFPGEEEPTPAEPEDPKPANPVQKVCENGRIIIQVGNGQHFGHRIMDLVEVTVLIVADNDIKFDFTSLSKGVIGFEGQDFDLAKPYPLGALAPGQSPVTIQSAPYKQGQTIYRIDLIVQSSVPKKAIPFQLDLRYAVDTAPDGKTPNWKRLTTPDFIVTTSNTADNGDELLEGDLEMRQAPRPWAMWPTLVGGIFLALLWPALVIVRRINREKPIRKSPPNEVAWRVYLKVTKQVAETGWQERHYKLMAAALRQYFGVDPSTINEVGERLKDHAQLDMIMSYLAKTEAVLFQQRALSEHENNELCEQFEELVPRPILI
ncbi:MAG: hypothetical protein IT343_13815 [Candidatus Melainabacteria bacterium]|nr:hypothetical protein [Candidatus Melainabacteria bacterium]